MIDPVALLLTIGTYGTWLPGDQRGWVAYQQGVQLPDPAKKLEAAAKMTDDACRLSHADREIVEQQVAETATLRGWVLHAVNCRTNHLHVVVSAPETAPKKIRSDIKAWCTRRLKERSDQDRVQWWAERGSIRWVFTDDDLERAIIYVKDAQDRKHRDHTDK